MKLRTHTSRSRLLTCTIAACAVVSTTAVGAWAASATGAEEPRASAPRGLVVLNANVENLETAAEVRDGSGCGGDWRDLFHAVDKRGQAPDVVLVQQVSGPGQVKTITDMLESDFRGTDYGSRIVERNPERFGGTNCDPSKLHQTNAIIFRSDRLAPLVGSERHWQANVHGNCRDNDQDRTRAMAHGFRDRDTRKRVLVGVVHWATNGSGGGFTCSRNNAQETLDRMSGGDYDLRIFGGDFNVSDHSGTTMRAWHDVVRRAGYRDPIEARCRAAERFWKCLNDQWTIGHSNRIDMMFARSGNRPAPTRSAHTITFAEGDAADPGRDVSSSRNLGQYSDHRAMIATVGY